MIVTFVNFSLHSFNLSINLTGFPVARRIWWTSSISVCTTKINIFTENPVPKEKILWYQRLVKVLHSDKLKVWKLAHCCLHRLICLQLLCGQGCFHLSINSTRGYTACKRTWWFVGTLPVLKHLFWNFMYNVGFFHLEQDDEQNFTKIISNFQKVRNWYFAYI